MEKNIKRLFLMPLISCFAAFGLRAASVSDYNVVWDSPSADCNGSMPIGNGDIGANVWVEDGGDLLFYIGKTDAREENARLVKLGKVRVRLNPNPFAHGCTFKQELDLENGVIRITSATKSPGPSADLRFWIDANRPAIRITGSMSAATAVEVRIEPWRTERTEAKWEWSFSGLADSSLKNGGFPYPVFIEPDTVVAGRGQSIVWYHRNRKNEHSVWEDTLKVQGLGDFIKQSSDPLLDLTFGALVQGDGLVSASPTTLKSAAPRKEIDIYVIALTARTLTTQEWVRQVEELAADGRRTARDSAWAAHKKWWNEFWNRSWISIDGKPGADAFVVSRGYALQNWVTACAGRGNLPISFNGSIFTVDGDFRGTNMGPDYRRWGSCYWFQNTRLPYWPMLAAGHYDMMRPLFKMYLDALPLARHRVRTYYGFDGAVFPETMHFWGAYRNEDYGWHRNYQSSPDEIDGKAIQYHWEGGLELTAMMLEYYRHTLDRGFLNSTLLPFAKAITGFYDNRYKRDERGKLVIHPANALEDVQDCTNPAPELAGLRYILPQLIELGSNAQEQATYARLLGAVPDLPRAKSRDGREYLLPAEMGQRRGNCEKPECYALFPYRL